MLLLLDYWPLDRFRRAAGAAPPAASRSWLGRLPVGWRLVVEKIPLMALAAASCGIAMSTHSSLQLGRSLSSRLSLATRLANALVSYAAYLGQSFYPVNLAPYYPHPGTHLPIAWAAGSLVLLVAITAVAAYCLAPAALSVGRLALVFGNAGAGHRIGGGRAAHARADRYTYLSQIGLSIALAWGVWSVYRSRQSVGAARWRRWMLAAVSGAAVLALAAVAWRQTSYWRDAETLWTHALACTGANLLAHYGLALLLSRQGRTEEAIVHLREAVAADSIDPHPDRQCP